MMIKQEFMNRFSELKYLRPDYIREKDILLQYRNNLSGASSYRDIRQLWLSMKESMQHLGYMEKIAYIRYLCGISLITAIKDMFTDISAESGEYIYDLLGREFYDITDRPNKSQSHFCCCMLPYIKMPFIIGCFHGKGLDINYLIHEIGHGFAFYRAARSQKLYEYHRAATSVNEIHSKTMEHLAYPYLERFFGDQKNTYIRNHLFHSFDNLPYRCAIDEFEHALYYDISLSRTKRCELWAEIEKKYMPWRNCDLEAIKRGSYWPNQSHLFTHPFYYIEYNIAQISAFEFYERSKHNYSQTWQDYTSLCRTGGSLNYLALLKVGNLNNPFTRNAAKNICTPVLEELFSLR